MSALRQGGAKWPNKAFGVADGRGGADILRALARDRQRAVARRPRQRRAGSYRVYVQMPNAMALNGNSRVLVADVFVGTVRAIDLKNWVATLTVGPGEGRQASEERHRQDRPDQPVGFSAHRIGRTAQPCARSDCRARRHHPAEQRIGLPSHRTDPREPGPWCYAAAVSRISR